ncbi:hypothetical protein ANO11243_082420 [Dothideomycetidae sp. 11243]|nr:hypothetical protein ANO11243_082420 [fungal sp. No.11243]
MAPKTRDSEVSRDDRFSKFSQDPRYRLPSSKNARVAVDKRFSRMFKEDDQDFNRQAKVDKYGRKVQRGLTKHQKNLKNLYKEEDEEEEGEESEPEHAEPKKGGKAKLRRVDSSYDPARDGGFSSSDSDSSYEESEAEDAELPDEAEAARVPMGEASARLAIVNLDWDNIRAADIFAVASSFVPADGFIKSCAIYPSEFGKERLEREELEGPPKEIFASSDRKARPPQTSSEDGNESNGDSEEDDDEIEKRLQKGDNGEEFDPAALRRYQLDRLRYFYAVLTCSSAAVAHAIYTELDGKEYMTTANFFDLRFIPDDVSFSDDKPKETVRELPSGYKPNEFVTEALTHSKVKLTWDADDASRKEVQRRAFSRKEIDENDLRAYIGGSSDSESEEDEAADEDGDEAATNGKQSKKEAERQRMRALLGLRAEKKEKKEEQRPVGDMQVTFTSGLSGGREGRGVFENSPPRDETTRERYVRKEKERKARRREKAKAKRSGAPEDGQESDSDIGGGAEPATTAAAAADEQDPFDDPFFNDDGDTTAAAPKSKKDKQRKADRIAKRDAKRAEAERVEAERAQLQLLMDDGAGGGKQDEMKHFDMKAIAKAAKAKNKKGKKGKAQQGDEAEVVEPIETADPRFASRLFGAHEFAIDPTNPRFVNTEAMQSLLDEGRKRRRKAVEEDVDVERKKVRTTGGDEGADDTQELLARVKAKAKSKR